MDQGDPRPDKGTPHRPDSDRWTLQNKLAALAIIMPVAILLVTVLVRDIRDNGQAETAAPPTPGSSSSATPTAAVTTPASTPTSPTDRGPDVDSDPEPRGPQPDPPGDIVDPDPVSVDDVRHRFTVTVTPGMAYDLDIDPGENPLKNSGWSGSDGNYAERDLYRTSKTSESDPNTQLQGVQVPVESADFNRVVNVGPTDEPQRCRSLTGAGSDRLRLVNAQVGSQLCVKTRKGRWAMVRISRMPRTPADSMEIRVTLLR
jgi:hypothetical protein